MKNFEILQRYKAEVNCPDYHEIHKKYKSELALLNKSQEVKNYLSIPLAIIAVICIIGGILCIFFDAPIVFYVFLGILIVALVVKKLNNVIVEHREERMKKSNQYKSKAMELKYNYLENYGSVVGFIDDLNNSCCDYDERTEDYYCSVTGQKIDYPKYWNCQKKYAFNRCELSKMYYDNLYED